MCKHNEKLCPRPVVPHWRLVSEASPLILRVYLQNNSQRRRSGFKHQAPPGSGAPRDVRVGEGPGSSACQPQPLRFTELGKKSLALPWRSLLTNGALPFGDVLDDFASWHTSGKERGWSPIAGWGSGELAHRGRGEEGEKGRMVTAPLNVLFPYQIKWKYDPATSPLFYRSYSNGMYVSKNKKVMKTYLIICTGI